MRNIKFQNGKYYHIYNRGVDKREVFLDKKDYFDFLFRLRNQNNESTYEQRILAGKELSSLTLKELSSLPCFVEIIAYCLIPNHYHLLLKQKADRGIEKFMHKIGTGYTNSFNRLYERSGSLFQGPYKSVAIKTDEQLFYTTSYINGNAEIHKIVKAAKWPYSSYPDYLNQRTGSICQKQIILKNFSSLKSYQEYTQGVIANSQEIKEELKYCQIEK